MRGSRNVGGILKNEDADTEIDIAPDPGNVCMEDKNDLRQTTPILMPAFC